MLDISLVLLPSISFSYLTPIKIKLNYVSLLQARVTALIVIDCWVTVHFHRVLTLAMFDDSRAMVTTKNFLSFEGNSLDNSLYAILALKDAF